MKFNDKTQRSYSTQVKQADLEPSQTSTMELFNENN